MPAPRSGERGQVLILMALSMVVLLGFVGLAVDVGLMMAKRRNLVRIADAAALAGAGALSGTLAETDALRRARALARAHEYALLHGLDPDATGSDMVVSFPETVPARKLVEVTAADTVPLAFMKLFGYEQAMVSSGARQGEAAPLDIVMVNDVSGSQCQGNYNIDLYAHCARLMNPRNPNQYWPTPWEYRPEEPTTAYDWPPLDSPPGRPGYRTNVPWSPFYQQQYAGRFFVRQLDPRYDQIGIVSFSSRINTPYGSYTSDARTHLALTNDFGAAERVIGFSSTALGQGGRRGLFPGGATNTSAGIREGVRVLSSSPATRPNAVAVMIILSDGAPTVTVNGTWCPSMPASCSAARRDTMTEARAAVDAGTAIYTIFVGAASYASSDALLMQWIADLADNRSLDGDYSGSRNLPTGSGPAHDAAWFRANVSENYYLATDYAQLEAAYRDIFDKIYTRLVQ